MTEDVSLPDFLSLSKGRTVIAVFLQPGSSRRRLGGVHGAALKVAVTAPPVEGRANQALERFLAEVLGVRATAVSVISGAGSRSKRVAIEGLSPPEVASRLHRAEPT